MDKYTAVLKIWIGLGVCAYSGYVSAQGWSFQPSADMRQIATDNINLASDSKQADTAMITEISPKIAVSHQSKALNVEADYQIQQLIYESYQKDADTNHLLNAKVQSTLLENYLHLDFKAKTGESLNDINGTVVKNTVSEEQKNRFLQYEITPYVLHEWGKKNSFLAKYQYDKRDYEQDNADVITTAQSSTYSDSANFALQYQLTQKIDWSSFYNVQNSHSENTDELGSLLTKDYSSQLGYRLSDEWQLLGKARGERTERYGQELGKNGDVWLLGAAWSPSPKLYASLLLGDNAFESNLNYQPTDKTRLSALWTKDKIGLSEDSVLRLTADYQQRYWRFGVRHSQESTTETLLNLNSFASEPANTLGSDAASLYSAPDAVVTIRTTGMNVGFERKKLRAGFDFYVERRADQQTDDLSYLHSAVVDVTWFMNRRSELSFENTWEYRELLAQDQVVDFNSVALNWLYRITRDIQGTLQYQYSVADSDVRTLTYVENRLSASVEVKF